MKELMNKYDHLFDETDEELDADLVGSNIPESDISYDKVMSAAMAYENN